MLAGEQESFFLIFHEFGSSLVWEFELFQEFGLFQEFCKIYKICNFCILQLLLGDCLQISHRMVRKLYCI